MELLCESGLKQGGPIERIPYSPKAIFQHMQTVKMQQQQGLAEEKSEEENRYDGTEALASKRMAAVCFELPPLI